MQNNSITIRIDNAIEQISQVADAVDRAGREFHISQRTVNDMNVVLDELLSNIIHHGYADNEAHQIQIKLSWAESRLCATVEDNGKPFDPTRQPPMPLDRDATAAAIGGLGLHFVHALTDSVTYVREGNVNRISVCKRDMPEQPNTSSTQFKLHETVASNFATVAVEGQLNRVNSTILSVRLHALVASGKINLIVDLQNVSYIASAGFWALLSTRKKVEARAGRLLLCGIEGEVSRLFELTAFRDVFDIYPSTDAARASVPGRA